MAALGSVPPVSVTSASLDAPRWRPAVQALGEPWPASGLRAGCTPHTGTAPGGAQACPWGPLTIDSGGQGPSRAGSAVWPQRGPPPLCAPSPHPGRAVTRPMGAHGTWSTQDSAQQQARSTQRGARTGTPHQHRRGPPGTRDRTQSRACPRRAHGMCGPLCRAHTYRCRGEDGATAESWGARKGQEGAEGRANPPASARQAAGAQRDPEPVPPWAPWAGPTALPRGRGGGGDRSEVLSPLLRVQAHPSALRGCVGRGQELRGRNS